MEKTYVERNTGNLRLYRITAPRGKFWRAERSGNNVVMVCYCYDKSQGRNEILLTEEGAKSLAHLELVPVMSATAANNEDEEKIHVPADWEELPLKEKCKLANKLNGKRKHKTHSECTETIKSYLGV